MPLFHTNSLLCSTPRFLSETVRARALAPAPSTHAMTEESSQAAGLGQILQAKRDYDEAVARIDECVQAGALSFAEGAEQRAIASRALARAKEEAGVAVNGQEDTPTRSGATASETASAEGGLKRPRDGHESVGGGGVGGSRKKTKPDGDDNADVIDLTDLPTSKDDEARHNIGNAGCGDRGGGCGGEIGAKEATHKKTCPQKKEAETKTKTKEKAAYESRVHCFTSCRAGGRPKCICGRSRFLPDYCVIGPGGLPNTHEHTHTHTHE